MSEEPKPVGNDKYLTEMDIRIFLRDTDPVANKLIGDLEFNHEEIRHAMSLTVDRWNETPPPVATYTFENFPFRYHLLMGTAANLFTMAASSYRRNRLNYNITGGSIDDQDKRGEYEAAGERLAAQFGEWMMRKKLEIQMNVGWGDDYYYTTQGSTNGL